MSVVMPPFTCFKWTQLRLHNSLLYFSGHGSRVMKQIFSRYLAVHYADVDECLCQVFEAVTSNHLKRPNILADECHAHFTYFLLHWQRNPEVFKNLVIDGVIADDDFAMQPSACCLKCDVPPLHALYDNTFLHDVQTTNGSIFSWPSGASSVIPA